MKTRVYLALCCVSLLCGTALSEGDNEVKRGLYPYMGFLYYPDQSVTDSNGVRFVRAAVLIRPEWLLSAAIDHTAFDNVPLGFPRKTLLARMGAISMDNNFSLNEDEDEQEREIIQIVRPNLHNPENWWFTDISLLKTLLPFKITFAVATTNINAKREYADKNCAILVYAKRYGNVTEDKNLMQLTVELLPPSIENCGNQFSGTTMTCGNDSDETKTAVYDPNFCQGNSGGPLLCEGEVMGLQTYIDGNCRQPHLYQLLNSWDSFIGCGTLEKCNQDYTCNICTVTNKDNSLIREKGTVSTINQPSVTNPSTTTAPSTQTHVSTKTPPINLTTTAKPKDDDDSDKEDQPSSESAQDVGVKDIKVFEDKNRTSIWNSTEFDENDTKETTSHATSSIGPTKNTTQIPNSSTSLQTNSSKESDFIRWPETKKSKNNTNKHESDNIMRMAKVEARRVADRAAPPPPPPPAAALAPPHRRHNQLGTRSAASKNFVYCLVNAVVTVFTLLLVL